MDRSILELGANVATPLGVAGLALCVLYLLYRLLFKGRLLSVLGPTHSFHIINRVATFIFILSLVSVVFGFGSHIMSKLLHASEPRKNPQNHSLSIKGKVIDSVTGDPIAGAMVKIVGHPEHSFETTSNGEFYFERLLVKPEDSLILEASQDKDKYKKHKSLVNNPSNELIRLTR